MKLYSTLLIVVSLATQAYGQSHSFFYQNSIFDNKDKVNEAIEMLGKQSDTIKIGMLQEIGKYYLYKSGSVENKRFELAVKYFQEAVRLSDLLYSPTSELRCENLMLLGDCYMLNHRIAEGEKLYQIAIGIFKETGSTESEAYACYRLGNNRSDLAATDDDVYAAASMLERSKQLFHKIRNEKSEIYCGLMKAYLYMQLEQEWSKMVDYLKLLEELSLANDDSYLPHIYSYLSYISRYEGNLPGALTYSQKALAKVKETSDTTSIDEHYGEIALAYGDLGRSEESILYYRKCLEHRKQRNLSHFVINRTAVLMTGEMIKLHRFNEALELLKSLQQQQQHDNNVLDKAILEHGIANCLAASGQIKLAEQYYTTMILKYEAHLKSGEVRLTGHVDFTKFLIAQKKFSKAATYHDQLEFQSVSTTIARRSEVEHLLFKIDSSQAKFPEAIHHYEEYKRLDDLVFNEIKSGQIEEMNARFKSDQKDKNIALLKQEAQLHEASLKQSAIQRNSLLAGTVMLGLLLSVLYSRYRLKLKSNRLLEKQQEEITRKNFAQQLLINEKDWLVREIHHRVKNNFHMVVGLMGTQASYIKNNEALQALEDSKHRINTMSLIHQKLYQSESLSATFMADYFHELVSYLKDSFNIPNILFVVDCEPIQLELPYSLPIGLIVNEAVTNSIKYAFPENQQGKISIKMHHTASEEIQLTISDTGIGIPELENGGQANTMGMNLMKGLTDDISGSFSIRNQSGTIIQINFPYDSEKYKATSPTDVTLA